MSGSQSPTPRKGGVLAGLAVSPHPQRFHEQGGPSASSTPCREKRGSIVDELKVCNFYVIMILEQKKHGRTNRQ